MKIGAVVLDIGVVLLRLNFKPVFDALGLDSDKSIRESVDTLSHWPPHDAFERGTIDEAEFLRQVELRFHRTFASEEFRALWNTVILDEVPGVQGIVRQLSGMVPLFALTNATAPHLVSMYDRFPWFHDFRKVFTSFELGLRKPEPEIYQAVTRDIEIPPEETLFIDDRIDNVQGARSVGYHAEQCVDSPRELIAALKKYGFCLNPPPPLK